MKISIGEIFLIFPVLTFILVLLKLLNILACSWLWILSPLWIPTSIIGTIVIFVIIMVLAYENARHPTN